MTLPTSIHDPVTPDQARHLPCFFWNVRPPAAVQRRLDIDAEQSRLNHEKYLRQKARDQAKRAGGAAHAQADLAISNARMVDPHKRRGRMA